MKNNMGQKIPTISTCLIVKNESICIKRCIESILPFSDEIVIFDTGSDDGTQDICRQYDKVKLIQGEWKNDFAWARNESFKYANCDYIMWVDADDVIEEKDISWFENFKREELYKYDMVSLEYIYDAHTDGTYSLHFYRERIFKRSLKPKWFGRIHEYVILTEIEKPSLYCVPFDDFVIKHYKHSPNPKRNWEIYKAMEENHEINNGRDWFYYGRECMWCEGDDSAIDKFKTALACSDLWAIDKLNIYRHLSEIYLRKGDEKESLHCLYLAGECTDIPRADVCCDLGDRLYFKGKYKEAIKWYEMAYENTPNEYDGTFMEYGKDSIYPLLQLCVIEYKIGHKEKAKEYNDKVFLYEKDNKIALYNKQFFDE